jgi:hypothetical protein
MRLITEHREQLNGLAAGLLRNEVLERRDIDRVMEGVETRRHGGARGLRVVAAKSASGADS